MGDLQANVYGDPNKSPARQLWLAGNAWHRMIRRALEPLGLTHAQYLLLASLDYLSQTEADITLRRLCRFAPMDENMASQVMKSIIERGWASKSEHPTDRRAQVLVPTNEGRLKVAEALSVSKPANAKFFAPLGQQSAELAAMLFALVDEPSSEPAHPGYDNHMPIVPMIAVSRGAEALQFYAEVFAAKETVERMVEDDGKISHSEFTIGSDSVMLTDEMPGHNATPDTLGGTSVLLLVGVEDLDRVVEAATIRGSVLVRPIGLLPNGSRLAKIRDPYGHVWMVHELKSA